MESADSTSSPEPRIRSYTPSHSSQRSYARSTSRHHSPQASFSPEPYLQRPTNLIPSTPRYPESAQRTLPPHDHTDGHDYLPPTAAFHFSEPGPSRAQYMPPEEGPTGHSNFYTPQASPAPMDHQMPPYLSADKYSSSLRSYHSMHLSELQYRRAAFPPLSLDDFRTRQTDAFHAQGDERLLHSPPRHAHLPMQDAHSYYRPLAPPPTPNPIPRHGTDRGHPPRSLLVPSTHAPSSIPMCNPSDRIYYDHAPRHTNNTHLSQSRHPTLRNHEHVPSDAPIFSPSGSAMPASGVFLSCII